MTYANENVSTAELGVLSSGAQTAKSPHAPNMLVEVGILAAHAAFYPLAFFAALPEASKILVGSDLSFVAMFFLVLFAVIVAATKNYTNGGALAQLGVGIMSIGLILLVPAMLGFVALALIMFSVAGMAAMAIIWKGIVFFGFMFWYLNN